MGINLYVIYIEVTETNLTINVDDSPLEEDELLIETTDELSNDKDRFPSSGDDICVFKNSPIDDPNDFDTFCPGYNCTNGNHDEDDDDIGLPPVNMMMDVLEHILTEVPQAPSSSSSSSTSEPSSEPLDIVPESPKLITSTPFIMDNTSKETLEKNDESNKSSSNNDKPIDADTCKSSEEQSKEKKKGNKLSLICNKITKVVDASSDLSTPSPIEEISKLQLRVEQQETESVAASATGSTMTTSLSTMSLISSVMAKHKAITVASNNSAENSGNVSKCTQEEAKPHTAAVSTTASSTTVNACADFFHALLKSDKSLTSTSNQGNY